MINWSGNLLINLVIRGLGRDTWFSSVVIFNDINKRGFNGIEKLRQTGKMGSNEQ